MSTALAGSPEARPDPCPYALVDCDVHPIMGEGMASLKPFLSAAGQRRLGLDGRRTLTRCRRPPSPCVPPP